VKNKVLSTLILMLLSFSVSYGLVTEEEMAREHSLLMNRKYSSARLIFAGDLMMHMPTVNSVLYQEGGDFSRIFEHVTPYLKGADFSVVNLETTLTSGGEYSGYPRFKSPLSLAEGIRKAGFDGVVTANNHAYDYRDEGVLTTLNALEEAGLKATGTFRGSEEAGPLIFEINRVSLGITNMTYGINGMGPVERTAVNLISEELLKQDYEAMVRRGTDVEIVFFHWGNEYQFNPDRVQEHLGALAREIGYDLIIGSHPHVVQPVIIGKDSLTVYSLGNFISNQRDGFKDLGLMVDLTVEKTLEGIEIRNIDLIPTWVNQRDQGSYHYRVIPLRGDFESLESIDARERDHLGNLMEKFDELMP